MWEVDIQEPLSGLRKVPGKDPQCHFLGMMSMERMHSAQGCIPLGRFLSHPHGIVLQQRRSDLPKNNNKSTSIKNESLI